LGPHPIAPATFDHYLLYAQTNDRELVLLLHRVGLSADLVPGIAFSRGRVAVTRVPWPREPYKVSVHGYGFEAPHDHDNSYWHDGRAGTSRFEIRFYHATDRGCVECHDTGVSTTSGGPIAYLLGRQPFTPAYVGFDHNKVVTGEATLFAPRRLTLARARPQGFLGVEGIAIAPGLGQTTGLTGNPVPSATGVLVTKVIPGEAAARAGIRGGPASPGGNSPHPVRRSGGDIILAVNQTPVSTLTQLATVISAMRPGSRVILTIVRAGKPIKVPVVLSQQ
jgi:hypothetical protein